jgi:hypothetical protein
MNDCSCFPWNHDDVFLYGIQYSVFGIRPCVSCPMSDAGLRKEQTERIVVIMGITNLLSIT